MIRIAICDDDVNFCAELEKIITQYAAEQSIIIECDVYTNINSIYNNLIYGYVFDLIFLDIEFPGNDGLTESEGIKLANLIRMTLFDEFTQIVFISWHEKYSLQLHGIHILDFLNKPINEKKVSEILDRLIRIRKTEQNVFSYKINKDYHTVQLAEIAYFKSKGRLVVMYGKSNDVFDQFYGKISEVWQQVNRAGFLYIHNRFLVNSKYIQKYEYSFVIVGQKSTRLPIAQSKRKEIRSIQIKLEGGGYNG